MAGHRHRTGRVTGAKIDDWFARAGWENVFTRNATAFRKLSADQQSALSMASAKALILEDSNFIRRPLLDSGSTMHVGFHAARWEAAGLR